MAGAVRILVSTMVFSAQFSCRSPPLLRRCLMVMPEEAAIGQIPPNMANAAALRIRPGCDQTVRITAVVSAPTPGKSNKLRSRGLHEVSDLFTVLSEVVLERCNPLREVCRFGAGGCCPQCFFAATPARDRRDLRSGEGSASVDAEVVGPKRGR